MQMKSLFLRIALGMVTILLVILSALPVIPPRAVAADAPATVFSAERAMADLQVVAREPHAAGSEAQARVREYIVGEVAAVGLQAKFEASGKVTNILVLLPGTASTGTVLATSHYDSHPPSPGAGDNGISTAAMLETIRVLQANPPLQNDTLFLFTDGEELGWLGASAYLKTHPKAQEEINLALVFDARPGNAPLTLLETSPGDTWLVRQMAGLPLPLWAGYWNNREERSEMDTDFDVFQKAGYIGVAFENEANGTRYHTVRDSVEAISPHLVQAYGQTMHRLANRFGSSDLRTRNREQDSIFFTLPLIGIIVYPTWVMPILSGLGLLALVSFVFTARRRSLFSFTGFGSSLLGLLTGTVMLVAIAQLVWSRIKEINAVELASAGGFETSSAWQASLMILAVVLSVGIIAILNHRLSAIHLVPAASILYLLVWLTVFLFMDADNPLTTPYIAWPFLGGIAGMGVLLFTRNPIWKMVLLSFCALAVLVLLVPQLWLTTYTREDAWIPVLAACLPIGFLAPQVEAIFKPALKNQAYKQ